MLCAFLRTGIAARSEAMGRAYVAMVEGNESAFYNPASVTWLENREATISYHALSLDRAFGYIAFGMPIRPPADSSGKALNAGLSLSLIHSGVDNIDARNFDGDRLESFSNSEDAVSLSFGIQLKRTLSVGLTGRWIRNRIPDVKRDGGAISETLVGC